MSSLIAAIVIGIVTALYKLVERKGKETFKPFLTSNRDYGNYEQPRKATEARKKSHLVQSQQFEGKSSSNLESEYNVRKQKAVKAQQTTDASSRIQKNNLSQLENVEREFLPHQLSLEEKALVDAVILSEILGPPRAKKPHFASRLKD
ncbi:MAG: hypothetical protein Q8906_12135 [Bacillota bacterium]|nr:hypothetical protein [Bacillota bacterium]MDP4171351.1 hypothetical protein [Bacillota bacterium]